MSGVGLIFSLSSNYGQNKKESDFFEQVKIFPDGDDKRVEFQHQVSVLGEHVVGVDSYPVELAFLAKESNTTDKTIINATDVTETLQSDSQSSTPMFGGSEVGNYILIASKNIYEGVKVKYDTLGDVESDNVLPEFYKNDTDKWSNVSYMSTNSNPPFLSNADRLSLHSSEQIYFGFNPLIRFEPETWLKNTFTINGIEYSDYYWARFRIITPITLEPILEQVKQHSDSVETESQGIFFKGRARTTIDIPYTIEKNDIKDPANRSVTYTSNVVAGYTDNRLQINRDDGFLLIARRPLNLDTSIPLVVSMAFEVEGTAIGDVVLDCEAIQVSEGFVYDGNAPFTPITVIYSILQNMDQQRIVITFTVPVNKLKENSGVVIAVNRNANSNPLDTFDGSINRTNVIIQGYKWKL